MSADNLPKPATKDFSPCGALPPEVSKKIEKAALTIILGSPGNYYPPAVSIPVRDVGDQHVLTSVCAGRN